MTLITRTIPVLLVFASLFAASPGAQSPDAVNTLTPAEKSAGWILLFDGKTIDQWRGYKKPDMAGLRWKVEDGCLALPAGEGADTRGQRDIITTQEFDSFELTWDWRIGKGGNSGVKYFVTEKNESAIGHEYQVIDGAHPDAGVRDGRRRTAAFYDVFAAPSAKPHPSTSFNTGRVVVKGNHVEHWLNGAKVLEYERGSEAFRTLVAASKYKVWAAFGERPSGPILLQDHGNRVSFRSLKIRELAP